MSMRKAAVAAGLVGALMAGAAIYMAWVAHDRNERQAVSEASRRQAVYEARLQAIARVIRPGTTRREVEGQLRALSKPFVRMCSMRSRQSQAFDVLTKIGAERAPWYCSELNVYVGFEFDAIEEREALSAEDGDILKEIRLFHWHEGCL
jgi:hypothetical protein